MSKKSSEKVSSQKDVTAHAEKAWEELEISDNFIFGKVMENIELCKELLELILDIKIDYIEYPEVEKAVKITYKSKGIRLDVHVADVQKTVYNIEMQANNTYELPQRSRYYQGIIDMELIEKGKSYSELSNSYVIFICKFDLFKKGRCRYTFEHRCVEDSSVRLGDGTTRIFLNTKGVLEQEGISEDLKAFLEYVEGKETENAFVQRVADEVDHVKNNRELRGEYMNQVVRDHLSREEGRVEGRVLERIEMARDLNVPEEDIVAQLMKKFGLTREIVMEYMEMSKTQV